jgi:hypothetical protein
MKLSKKLQSFQSPQKDGKGNLILLVDSRERKYDNWDWTENHVKSVRVLPFQNKNWKS